MECLVCHSREKLKSVTLELDKRLLSIPYPEWTWMCRECIYKWNTFYEPKWIYKLIIDR